MDLTPVPPELTAADPSARPWVFFDWDGTLVDTRAGIIRSATQALLEWGWPEAELGDVGRLTGPAMPYSFCDVYGVTREQARELAAIHHRIYDAYGPETRRPFAGVPELLDDLRAAGRRLAITSSKREHVLTRVAAEQGVDGFFEAIIGAVHPERVDKDQVLAYALDTLGVSPDEVVMVGDRHYDVAGAAACGIPCVGADFGTARPGELAASGACAVAADVADLRRILLG